MKKAYLFAAVVLFITSAACQTGKIKVTNIIPPDMPRTAVPKDVSGNWMYGNFSMTEYWSTSPSSYIGNALQYAIAFTFSADGTYQQYFTSSSVLAGLSTYQQSVTNGTVEIDPVAKTIKTYPYKSHYKRTRAGKVQEERDMLKSELNPTSYTYATGTEPNGTKAIYLTLQGTTKPLTFFSKP